MTALRYEAPATVNDAVALLASANGAPARPLAGGTDLIVQMRTGQVDPGLVVDLKRIPELTGIRIGAGGLLLGAATCGAEIQEHAELCETWPGLAEAADLIGSSQVQGRASLGGNLCNASPAADSVPALIANAAVCRIAGPGGERRVPVEEFATGPGENALAPSEILVSLEVPRPAPRSGDAYLRLIPRSEMDIAVAGAAVALTLDADGRVSAARVVIGAVGPRACLVPDAAAALLGSTLEESTLERVAAAASAAANPIDDKRGTVAYRRRVVGVLAKRAALRAAERAGARS